MKRKPLLKNGHILRLSGRTYKVIKSIYPSHCHACAFYVHAVCRAPNSFKQDTCYDVIGTSSFKLVESTRVNVEKREWLR